MPLDKRRQSSLNWGMGQSWCPDSAVQCSAPGDAGTECAVHGPFSCFSLSPGWHELHKPIDTTYNLHHAFSPSLDLSRHSWYISGCKLSPALRLVSKWILLLVCCMRCCRTCFSQSASLLSVKQAMQIMIISDWVFLRRNYHCCLNFLGVSLVRRLEQEGSLPRLCSWVLSGIGAVIRWSVGFRREV